MSPQPEPTHGMEYTRCNLCHSAEYDIWLEGLPDYLLNRLDVTTTLVKCRECGLIYQNPRPPVEMMGAHYPAEYQPFVSLTSQGKASRLAQALVSYGIEKRCKSVTRWKTQGKILDVGCATGEFPYAMSKKPGWQAFGVEVSEDAAQYARANYGLEVFTGVLEDAPFAAGAFDVITLWEVLEHLHDPTRTLETAHRLLKNDGLLVLRLPNLASSDARRFGSSWAGYDAPRHLYVFSPQTLRDLLQKSDLRVVEMHTRLGSYGSFSLSASFWMMRRGVSPRAQKALRFLLRNPVFRAAVAPYFWLSGMRFQGPTLTAIATKASGS